MMDSKVGSTGGKLTQLVDVLEVQNINKLLHITVHTSVRYTKFCPLYTILSAIYSTVRYIQFCPLYVSYTDAFPAVFLHAGEKYTTQYFYTIILLTNEQKQQNIGRE
jgi:hypothetical protein